MGDNSQTLLFPTIQRSEREFQHTEIGRTHQ